MRKHRCLTTATGFGIPALKSLPVAALLLAGMTACSEEEMPGDNATEPDALELQSSGLNVMTDPAKMPATVYNYAFGNSVGSRADYSFTMPAVPDASVYANLPELQQWQPDDPAVAGYVVSGTTKLGFQNLGKDVYVTGKWTITGTYGDASATIWVLPGATLEFDGGGFEAGAGHITINNYGTLAFTNGENQCRLGGKLTINSQADIDQIPNLNLACEVHTNGAVNVKRVHFNNAADVWIGCKIEATEEVIFDNEATFHVGYIKSPKVSVMANPTVVVRDGGYIETDEFFVENVQSSKIYAEEGEYALIKANTIRVNNAGGENLKGTFGNVCILCDNWIYGEQVESTKDGLGLNASVKLNEEVDVKIENTNDACAPAIVVPGTPDEPTPDVPEKPSLETIASVTNDHTHPISATCIQFNGDKAYVSWHERGAGIHGCIEVVENTPEGLKLLAYAEDPATDYNHIMFDGNRLLTVGHNDQHAVVGEIALVNGAFTQGEQLKFVNLKGNRVPHADNPEFVGGDGNCIVRNGNYISVASYGGLHTLNSDLTRINEGLTGAVPTTGSAKHLSIVGGKILELNLTERVKGAESAPAELRLFDATDYTWSNPTVIASDLTVTPIDGKNTIALDNDGSMYVCLGHGGVKKYTGTTCAATITEGNAPANGLCIDDKYLYVAFGKGLYIYAKNDLTTPVLKYTHLGRKDGKTVSCNYVAVNGDLIYLAYGLDGYDVIRMLNR